MKDHFRKLIDLPCEGLPGIAQIGQALARRNIRYKIQRLVGKPPATRVLVPERDLCCAQSIILALRANYSPTEDASPAASRRLPGRVLEIKSEGSPHDAGGE